MRNKPTCADAFTIDNGFINSKGSPWRYAYLSYKPPFFKLLLNRKVILSRNFVSAFVYSASIKLEVVAPAFFGPVHRRISMRHQSLCGRAILRIHRSADATADHDRLIFECDGRGDRCQNPLEGASSQAIFRAFLQHQHEFITTNAGNRVVVALRRLQAACDGCQQRIAGLVTKVVIDVLEAVEVNEHDPYRLFLTTGISNRFL